jgi:hypothetical protein
MADYVSDNPETELHRHPAKEVGHDDGLRRRRKSTSAALLHDAVTTLGADVVAPALGLTAAELGRLASTDKAMNLAQQHTLALAMLVLSEGYPELRRGAIGLLRQVRAAAEFATGTTETHRGPPPTNRWF